MEYFSVKSGINLLKNNSITGAFLWLLTKAIPATNADHFNNKLIMLITLQKSPTISMDTFLHFMIEIDYEIYLRFTQEFTLMHVLSDLLV